MEIQDILQTLEHFEEGVFPREALQEAIARRDEMIPELLKILEWAKDHVEDIYDSPEYMAHTYAIFLLAHFREKRAYPLIVEFFATPGDMIMDIAGDTVTEDLGRILASVCDGDTGLMKALAENPEADEYVRSAALDGLLSLFVNEALSREELIAYFHSLFREKLERHHSFIWDGLVSKSCMIYPEELYDDIRQAYQDELVEPFFVGLEDVERAISEGKAKILEDLRTDPHYHFVQDVIKEIEWWACFRTPEQENARIKKLMQSAAKKLPKPQPVHAFPESSFKPQPYMRRTKKVGRNDPCPCGSGKKYKKCCLNKQQS